MEFKIFRNIENGFKQIRMYAIAFAVLCSGVSIFAVGYAYYFAEKQREKIYVLDNGKSLMLALSQDEKINRPVEAKEHVRRFHELFFNLAPDKKAIEDNTKRAFFMADKSAFNYYKDLAEKGYYNRIISGTSNITERSLITSCRLINSVRSDNNPQGFIIEQFNVIENKDLRTVER